jgi:hypothetical protein
VHENDAHIQYKPVHRRRTLPPKIANKHLSKVRYNSQAAPCNKEMALIWRYGDDPKENFHDFRRGTDL